MTGFGASVSSVGSSMTFTEAPVTEHLCRNSVELNQTHRFAILYFPRVDRVEVVVFVVVDFGHIEIV